MGKTSLVVSMLMDENKAANRPLFVDGISDLKLQHIEPVGPVESWHEWLPDGAILVIDEVQRIFRPRSTGSKVPPGVQAMETHRHHGQDLWLITQSPLLLDSNIRRLVGRHIHIKQTTLGRYLYEWQEVGDPESKSSRDSATRRAFKPPARAFSQYKSAEVHTKTKFRLNQAFIWAGLALVALVGIGYYISTSMAKRVHPGDLVPSKSAVNVSDIPRQELPQPVQAVDSVLPDFLPREPGQEDSAPAYDHLRQVRNIPHIRGCILSRKKCSCYTDQGTRLQTVPVDSCRNMAQNGFFDPYTELENRPSDSQSLPGETVGGNAERRRLEPAPAGDLVGPGRIHPSRITEASRGPMRERLGPPSGPATMGKTALID